MSRLVALFNECLSLDPPTRTQRLAELDAHDPALALELRGLLDAHQSSLQFGASLWLSTATGQTGNAAAEANPELEPGTQLGRFRIEALVGKGGMGQVYRGVRADGTLDYAVAIKIARYAGRSAEAMLHEATLMERLRHPGIAQFYDILRLDDTHAAVVMEWVDGKTLDELMAEGDIAPERALQIAIDAAQALSYAHDRQVLHGDIKPSNVMIDTEGKVKLIDFGIGVLLRGADAAEPAIGHSPSFSAPETATIGELSTRSDLYCLGRLLLRMWVKSSAWSADNSQSHAEQLDQSLTRLASSTMFRRDDARAVIRKSCHWNEELRYRAAAELEQDLRSLLDSSQPRAAHWTILRRAAHRVSRYPLISSAAFLAAIAAVAFVATIVSQRSDLESKSRELERSIAEINKQKASAEASLEFILNALNAASTESSKPSEITVRDFADAAQRDLLSLKSADIDTAAAVAVSLAKIQHGLERYDEAIAISEQFLKKEVSASTQFALLQRQFEALLEQERLEQAQDLLQSDAWPETAADSWRLRQLRARLLRAQSKPAEAEALGKITLEQAPEGMSRAEQIQFFGDLATFAGDQGRLAEAMAFFERQRALIDAESEGTFIAGRNAHNRAIVHFWLSEFDEANVALEMASKIYHDRLDPNHSLHADLNAIKVQLLLAAGDFQAALELNQDSRETIIRQLGPNHHKVAASISGDGQILLRLGMLEASLEQFKIAEHMFEKLGDYRLGPTKLSICAVLGEQKKFAQAIEYCSEGLTLSLKTYDANAPDIGRIHGNLAQMHQALGQNDDALHHSESAMRVAKSAYPEDSINLAEARLRHATILDLTGRKAEAVVLSAQALSVLEKDFAQVPVVTRQVAATAMQGIDPAWLKTEAGSRFAPYLPAQDSAAKEAR